jgi:putative ABC transport system permease protein
MKTSIYLNYTSRSLMRGGQRTILAIFCIAVGVMAIVSLQLVGLMINNAFTANVRDANGGDIAVTSSTKPFVQSDLASFARLKSEGIITDYTALANADGSTSGAAAAGRAFTIEAVDPHSFPVVTAPTFKDPASSTIEALLVNNGVIVDTIFADQYNKKVGDEIDIHAGQQNQNPRLLHVRIAGIVTDSGVLAQSSGVLLISQQNYQAAAPGASIYYDTVDVTTADQAHTDRAVKAIQQIFPLASTQTAADALKSAQSQVDLVRKFLEIAGLMALLIGGVGIVNTMQVLLSRRKLEIAMLKTTGYRRFDLYLLFGLEAGLLGLSGGIVGAAAATGMSFLVRNLVQQVIGANIPFVLDPLTVGGGVLIGLFTALIFGLLPIVQAANIRPLNVIREIQDGNRIGSFFLTIGLLVVLSMLFCLLAIVILNSVLWGVISVYGAFIFLALLSLFFSLAVLIISKLPVPERFSVGFLALVMVGVALSVLVFLILPAFGGILLAASLLGFVIVLLPRTWKSSTKMALRNIGRQRARTTTTMLALFVGVFAIGLILALGQDVRDTVNNALARSLNYNVIAVATNNDANALQSQLATIPGIMKQKQTLIAATIPLAIDGRPLQDLLKNTGSGSSGLGRNDVLGLLSGVEGYDVAHNQGPDTNNMTITDGRNLDASDAGTNAALVIWGLVHRAPLQGHLHVGSTITLTSVDGKITHNVKVVGVYRQSSFNLSFESILTTTNTVQALSPAGLKEAAFYMKVNPGQVGHALGRIDTIAPKAFVFNLANIGDYINQYLNYTLLALTVIAGLSLLAGIIIIANAVALAMLERRRELGILKSVGYTSGTVLSEVLIENGVVGGAGALLAMLFVTLAMIPLGNLLFKASFSVSGWMIIVLTAGAALLAMITATLVAYGAVRVRPLEVLRYE